jgi:hypothetical protein
MAHRVGSLRRTDSVAIEGIADINEALLAVGATRMTDTVEKGILRGPLSNIDSRRASNEQDRFKNSFARIRLFQILIPQLHFGYFFNTIDPSETLAQHFLCGAHDRWPKCPYASMAFCFDDLKAPA